MNGSRKFIIVSTTVAILLIILVSISLAYAGRDNTLMKDKSLNLQINGFTLELPLSQNGAVYDPVCLTSLSDNRIKLENDLGAVVTINGKTIKAGSTINLKLEALTDNNRITIDVKNEKDHRIIYLRSISSELPKLRTVGKSLYAGNYYATLGGGKTGLYQVNTDGDLVFYIANSAVSPLNESYADFQKHILDNGTIRYSYQRIFKEDEGLGERIILDENYQYLKTITLKKSQHAKENEALTMPAFVLISDDHWLIGTKQLVLADNLASNSEAELSTNKIERVLIQEVLENQVIDEFRSDSFPQLDPLDPYKLDQDTDYTGFNGMLIDPNDDNLILSLGKMGTLIKVDLEKQKILWTLSGPNDDFALLPEQKISKVSSLSLSPQGEMIVFDEGPSDGNSRILKIDVDEMNKKVLDFQEIPLNGSFTQASSQKIGDALSIYTIAWGKNESKAITEMDVKTGKVLFEITLPEGYYFNGVKKALDKVKTE